MQIRDGIIEAIGHTPLIKLERASEMTGCTILGKAEFMNPGGSVKDRAGRQMILEAEARGELRPGGLVVEVDRRQYRHRPRAGRQCARLSHADRHPEYAEPGKEGRAAPVRRRTDRSAGAALQQSEQLSACRPPIGRATQEDREERRHLRRSVEQSRQSQGALRLHRPGNLAADRRQDRRLHLRRSAPAAPSPASRPICAKEKGHRHRARRSARRRDVQSVRAWRGQGQRGRLDHRRHRAWPRHPDHRRHQGRQALPDPATRKRCR